MVAELIRRDAVDLPALSQRLDAMNHDARVYATRTMPRASFASLFAAAAGFRAIGIDYAVPSGTSALTPVRHIGTNSLALFRTFEKPLYRADGVIGGRNVQPMSWLTGPGYFTVRAESGELIFDYVNLPRERPAGWPNVVSNARGFSYFVFRNLIDRVRAISEHVSIGRAFRGTVETPNYFILVRER